MCFLRQQVFSIFLLFFHKRPDVQYTTLKMMFSHSEQNWKNLIQKHSFADVLQNRCSKNFANSTGKHSCWSLLLKRLQVAALQHYQNKALTQVFSCEVCEIFQDTFFYRTPPVAASGDNKSHTRLFTLTKQAFSSHSMRHFSKAAYYLRFYLR